MSFVKAAKTNEIESGSMKTVRMSGKVIALACVDGEYFAIDDTCTHEQCSLGTEGVLDGNVVVCGCHGATFDVTNGKVLSLPAPTDVSSYEVKIEGDDVLIDI